jgi:hypothetical protein
LCILPYFLGVEKSTVQILSWTLEIYNPEFFVAHEGTKNKGVRLLSLTSPTNLMIGCTQFPDEILSINQYLSGMYLTAAFSSDLTVGVTTDLPTGSRRRFDTSSLCCHLGFFKRIVPPHAGLLRSYAFIFSFQVLHGLFKEGISMGRFTQGGTI